MEKGGFQSELPPLASSSDDVDAHVPLIFTLELAFRGLAPFSDEFVNERYARFYIFSNMPLGTLNSAFHRRDTQFVVFHAQDHFISSLDAECFPVQGGNDDSAVLVDAGTGFGGHVSRFLQRDTILR